jgi:hypothetical protein
MTERNEFLLNTILLLAIAGLVAYLVYDVRDATEAISSLRKARQSDMNTIQESNETAFVTRLYDEELFESHDHLAPIVTPIPTPTPVPIPTPTPAPPPFAENWQLIDVLGNVAQIRDYLGKMHYKRKGEELEGVLIKEVDWENKTIRVQNVADGREKTISQSDSRLPKKPGGR